MRNVTFQVTLQENRSLCGQRLRIWTGAGRDHSCAEECLYRFRISSSWVGNNPPLQIHSFNENRDPTNDVLNCCIVFSSVPLHPMPTYATPFFRRGLISTARHSGTSFPAHPKLNLGAQPPTNPTLANDSHSNPRRAPSLASFLALTCTWTTRHATHQHECFRCCSVLTLATQWSPPPPHIHAVPPPRAPALPPSVASPRAGKERGRSGEGRAG